MAHVTSREKIDELPTSSPPFQTEPPSPFEAAFLYLVILSDFDVQQAVYDLTTQDQLCHAVTSIPL